MKNFNILLLVFLLLNGCRKEKVPSVVAAPKADSLTYFFERANDDSLAVPQPRMFTEKAIALISNDPNDSMNRVNYFKVANRYWNMGEKEDFKKMTLFIIHKSKAAEDFKSLAKAFTYMVDYYQERKMLDSVYAYINEEEKVYEELDDSITKAKVLLKKNLLQHSNGDFLGAERSAFEILRCLNRVPSDTLSYEAYNALGIVYSELGEYELSIKYYYKSLESADRLVIPLNYYVKSATLNNIGLLYHYQHKYSAAIKYFNKALECNSLFTARPQVFAMLKDNLGDSKLKLKDFNELPDLFYEALKIRDSLNIFEGILINKVHLSEYYAFQKDTVTAIQFAKEARASAQENNIKRDELITLKQLATVDKKNAKEYAEAYFKISDSLQLSERKIRNQFARIDYETEALAKEKEFLEQQREVTIYIALLLVLIITGAFVIRFQIVKGKEMQLLSKQQQADDEIYRLMMSQHLKLEEGKKMEKKRIARELHDGVMGRLTGIRLNLFVLTRKKDPETIAKCLRHIDEIHEIEKEIQAIAEDLENNLFSGASNFVTVVRNLFDNAMTHSHLHFQLDVDKTIDWAVMDDTVKIHIYRIFQEALQNINKYAFAKTVNINMKRQKSTVIISIVDDGVGFDMRKIKKGLGLQNIQERAKEINGKITIIAAEGQGTTIHLTIKTQ